MAITTAQFAADYAALLEAQGVVLEDRPLFVVTFAGQLTDWLGGGDAIPAELAYRLKQTLGYWNAFTSGMVGFLTIDAEGGPNGDGTVTIVDGVGVTHTIDSLARLVLEMAGIVINGTLPTVGDLPAAGQKVGDIYLVGGVGFTWDGTAWVDIGPIRGPKGDAATIAVGAVTTVAPGEPATVGNSGTAAAAVLDFEIPQGDPGVAATVAVGDVVTGAAGSGADVTNVGTAGAAVFDFSIPKGDKGIQGDAATIAVGAVDTVAPGVPATVVNSGTAGAAMFDFEIPQGVPGVAATVAVGDVVTGAAGSAADVTNSGTAGAAVFDFAIPKGDKGERGEAFTVDAVGPLADRSLYDAELAGFSFLATDEALIYFRLDPVGWSLGAPFGRGEEGASAYDVAVANGFIGTEPEWLASLEGADGDDGSDASVTKANIETALGGPVVMTINGIGPDAAGDILVDTGGDFESDMIRVFLTLAELKGVIYGTPNGVADDFVNQSGVDLAASTNALWSPAGKSYTGETIIGYEAVQAIPRMTSFSSPAGHAATASSVYNVASTFPAWQAFDASTSTAWAALGTSGDVANRWVQRMMTTPVKVKGIRVQSPASDHVDSFDLLAGATAAGPFDTLLSNCLLPSTIAYEFELPDLVEYNCYRLKVTGGSNSQIANFELLGPAYGPGAYLDLWSVPYVAQTAPTRAYILAVARRVGTPIVVNTDIKGHVSRDGGTTWTQATLAARETLGGFTYFDAIDIDLTAQPADTEMRWRVEAGANVEVGAAALMWN